MFANDKVVLEKEFQTLDAFMGLDTVLNWCPQSSQQYLSPDLLEVLNHLSKQLLWTTLSGRDQSELIRNKIVFHLLPQIQSTCKVILAARDWFQWMYHGRFCKTLGSLGMSQAPRVKKRWLWSNPQPGQEEPFQS